MRVSVFLLSSAPLVAAHTPLTDLSVTDVQQLLGDWHLQNAFGQQFLDDEVDGDAFNYLSEADLGDAAKPFQVRKLLGARDALLASRANANANAVNQQQRTRRRRMEETSASGVRINSDSGVVAMGTAQDVVLSRVGDSRLNINSHVEVEGDLAVSGDVSFDIDDAETQTLAGIYSAVTSMQDEMAAPDPATALDHALKEARCSRVNCCNEKYSWQDSETLLCWAYAYEDYASDPCGCKVKVVESAGKTWKWHEKFCQVVHAGQLMSVHTARAARALLEVDTTSTSLYIGLHEFGLDEDSWQNVDGTPVHYLPWGESEPNDSGNAEDCVELYTGSGKYNDLGCTTVYDGRDLSACLVMEAQSAIEEATVDMVVKEAKCSKVNCCSDQAEWNGNQLQCWDSGFDTFELDPCACVITINELEGSWRDHEKYCWDMGGSLSSIHTSAAASRISEYPTSSSTIYVGLHEYNQTEGTWLNSDGTFVNWLEWAEGEPNNSGSDEDCTEMYLGSSQLNDITCDCDTCDTRFASACTTMPLNRNLPDVTVDSARKEALCNRGNCCNDQYSWEDEDTMLCWNSAYAFPSMDPCACTVEFTEYQGTWREHEMLCVEGLGGQLMSVHSQAATDAVSSFVTDSYTVYIGLHDYYDEDVWYFRDGTAFDWTSGWNDGEPNDSEGEDCGEVKEGGLNDIGCDDDNSGRFASACVIMQ